MALSSEQETKRRRLLGPAECPLGVKDCVEDRLRHREGKVRFGVIVGAGGTPFWRWMDGNGFSHVWTAQASSEIAAKLLSDPVDVVLFDYVFPRRGHPVWTASGLQVVVWHRSGVTDAETPSGWVVETNKFTTVSWGAYQMPRFSYGWPPGWN